MGEHDLGTAAYRLTRRRLSRRAMVRLGLAMAALPVLAACGAQQPAAPAKPTEAPAKPTEAAKPAEAAKPTAAPAAPAGAAAPTAAPTAAAKPAEAAKPAQTAAATSSGRTAPPAPEFKPVKIDGKLSVIIDADFHPDHNILIEKKVREFAEKMNYPLDFSTVAAFTGTANISQKLTAAVQSGDPPDCITHTEPTSSLHFLDVLEDVDDLQKQIIKDYGEVFKTAAPAANIDGKWWAVHHFTRAGGYWYREGALKAAGIDPKKDFEDWDKVREALLKASNPDKESWGWGMTANRSGDGNTTVQDAIMMRGGQITDEKGEIVVYGKDPYRQYAIDGLNFLKEIYTDPKWAKMLPTGVNSWTDPSNNEAYLAGKIFFSSNAGTMFAKAVFDNNPVKDDTYLMLPPKGTGPGGRVLAGGGTGKRWFVIKGAKNREAAEQLIRYMHSADIQKEMFKISNGYVYPAYEWGWDEPEIKASDAGSHVTDVWKQYVNHPSGFFGSFYPAPPVPWVDSLVVSNFWTDMFGEVLGGKSSEDAVKSAHDRAVRVAKEFGFKGE
jgi:multiple sugar transport system substrate-binding protein